MKKKFKTGQSVNLSKKEVARLCKNPWKMFSSGMMRGEIQFGDVFQKDIVFWSAVRVFKPELQGKIVAGPFEFFSGEGFEYQVDLFAQVKQLNGLIRTRMWISQDDLVKL